jgi:predicted  nucleic acid-binding Zn-ribbon protein
VASAELQRLWRLAQIDRQIVEVRTRAAQLDVGQRSQAAIDKLMPEYEEAKSKLKSAEQNVTDLELKQKGDELKKKKKIHQELYGGKIVNPREVANLEKEIAMIQKHQDEDAEKLLELYDLLPAATDAYKAVAAKYDALVKQRDERRKVAVTEKAKLEAAFKEASAKRPEAVKGISPGLLARYDNIRQLHGGIGMVEAILKTSNCGGCGTHLPERTLSLLKDDKVAICEDCHRLLYFTEGAV